MIKRFPVIIIIILLYSCRHKKQADLLLYNGIIYTVNSNFNARQAMAVKDGKIIDVGSNALMHVYDAKEKIDLQGKPVYPGFIDAHSHFYGYSTGLVKCNLYGTKSFAEVIEKVKISAPTNKFSWILGRGWDQNDWEAKQFPDKKELDNLFPDIPVFLQRVDGHAVLVNQKALDIAGITAQTKIPGGEIETANGKCTGILIDNAVDSVKKFIPEFTDDLIIELLMDGQKNCFEVGLTSVSDAGLDVDTILRIDSLQKSGKLKIRINAMITYDEYNKKYFFQKGKIKTDKLNVCAFKIYADGALGSRGACLLQPYSDKPNYYGYLLHDTSYLKKTIQEIYNSPFQLCTHCIGDSANHFILKSYSEVLKEKNNRRWRIEHCQVVNEKDFDLFGKYSVIPSVQPTHATSDMYWAEERIGKERMKGAYAYKQLMGQNGMIANGSDFPVESINPLFGFYAAVVRKDQNNFPDNGFQTENALTREEALKAMTIWTAYSNFEEYEKGSLEKGKLADFVILEEDIMKIAPEKIYSVKVKATYLNGEKVF
ncbi:MAG: amidohydrolase [Bacteroidia bacterium]